MTAAAQVRPTRPSPAIPNIVLGCALFLISEAMLFCGLASAYVVLRSQAGLWPPLDQPRLPVFATAINTAILIASGGALWRSVSESARGNHNIARSLRGAALALGTVFVVFQGIEWGRLIQHGLTSSSSLYGALFYSLVGCHGLHVIVALVVFARIHQLTLRDPGSTQSMDRLRAGRMYWTFVVLVWPPLYGLVYLW
jgi:heme/copper-type cytochrome/quinol oxidase subunit 3